MQSKTRGFFSLQQPDRWEEALICGNGTIGALVMSRPIDETIIFTHEKLFVPLEKPLLPVDTGSHLQEIREMFRKGQYSEAAKFVVELSKKDGYEGLRWTDPFFPACNLDIKLESAGEVEEYRRSLDFTTGLAIIEWSDDRGSMCRKTFVSRADGVAVMKLTSANTKNITCNVIIRQHMPNETNTYGDDEHSFINGIGDTTVQTDNQWILFRSCFKRSNSGYECVARVIPKNGNVKVDGNSIRVEKADEVLILFKIVPQDDMQHSHIDRLKEQLTNITGDFDQLLSRHVEIHGKLFNRVYLKLGEEEEVQSAEEMWEQSRQGIPSLGFYEKIFDAGRYEILSSCGDWPPTLQGVWAGCYSVPWCSDYTQDGNVQSAVSGLLAGNMTECMESYLNYMESLIPHSRVNAKRMYDCRGIMIALKTNTHGYHNHFDATWCLTFWTAGAGWAAHYFYDYWLHTGDNEFFINHALPFMKEASYFYEDFLIEDENGYWCFIPSYSPENTPQNSDSQATINATMDIAIARELFNSLIEGCETLGIEKENIPKWRNMLAKMPPYQINKDGALKEWCYASHEDRYDHRHASHLYPLYYGVAKELRDDPEIYKACARAYELRMAERKKEAGIMAFGMIQMGLSAAHLGDADTVAYILKTLASGYYYKNFASSHDMGPNLFNADISGGLPALILESLVQSHTVQDEQGRIDSYVIKLLPAIPKEWTKGSIKGVLTRGGFEVELVWEDGKVKDVSIRSLLGNNCRVEF